MLNCEDLDFILTLGIELYQNHILGCIYFRKHSGALQTEFREETVEMHPLICVWDMLNSCGAGERFPVSCSNVNVNTLHFNFIFFGAL